MIPYNDPNHQNQPIGFNPNPNFNPQNTHLGNLNGNPPMPSLFGANPNFQPMPQNAQLGAIQMLAMQIQAQQMGMLGQNFQGGPQFLPQNLVQNLNPMMGLQFLAQNQMMQGNAVMGLLGNPQLGPGFGFGGNPGAMGPSGMYGQWNNNMQQGSGGQQFQVNHMANNSNNPSGTRGFGKGELSHNRHDARSSRENTRQFKKKREGGQNNRRVQNLPSTNIEEAQTVHQRPIVVNYTEKEIQQWRQARRRNFPTKSNIEKKCASGSTINEEAKLRCQQLKEILAKQAELGVEVAEIPHSYLCVPEVNVKNVREVTNTNKFNKRRGRGRGRGRGRENWRAKKQKFRNNGEPSSTSPAVKREPSFLRKLLSADIKRDKSRLLQVFRFMVLNDFFKQWPDQPLDFPVVTAKDGSVSVDDKVMIEEIGSEKESSVGEDMGNGSDEETGSTSNEEGNHPIEKEEGGTEEQFEKAEEGEITD